MVISHFLLYYVWYCVEYNDAQLTGPSSITDVIPFFLRIAQKVSVDAIPNFTAAKLYFGLMIYMALLMIFLPGLKIEGMPVESLGGRKLQYNCNALQAWYLTLIGMFLGNYIGFFPISQLARNLGPVMTLSIIFSDVVALVVYIWGYVARTTVRTTGIFIYDFFMGVSLNPRIETPFGYIDLKMFSELRMSWAFLFMLTLSNAFYYYEETGRVSYTLLFLVLAHAIYANQCQKGEELVIACWDIVYEKWGWLLIFWNFAGVPFLYCSPGLFLAKSKSAPELHSLFYMIILLLMLFFGAWMMDTANAQKNKFRLQVRGVYVPRFTFPQWPWNVLENPKYLKTEHGNLLLVDGWWKIIRKPHYVGDLFMISTWSLITGFNSVLPYIFFGFFYAMIIHRSFRDEHRCELKYGKDWEKFCKLVPYKFIPFIY